MLRRKTRALFKNIQQGRAAPNMATVEAVNRITKLMTLYPCVYVLLTLPLSAGRMWSMAHHSEAYSDAFACIAGAMITSCGWVDSLLYTLTRRRLLQDTMPPSSSRRTGSNFDDELGSKGITHTRTVTVEGGQMMDTLGPTGQVYAAPVQQSPGEDRPPSPAGSMDPMLSGQGRTGKHRTEISVGLHGILAEEEEENIPRLPPGWVRHQQG